MTASLPDEVQAVFDRFITTELTTIDRRGQPITWPVTPYYSPGAPCIDVTTGLGYPEEGQRRPRQPARLAAVLRPHRLRPAATRRWSSSRAPPRSTTATSRPTASATSASRSRSFRPPRAAAARPAQAAAGLVLHADLHPRPARARVRLAARRHRSRAAALRRPHGGGSLRPLRGARPLPRRPRRRRQRLGRPARASSARSYPHRGPVARLARRLPVRGAGSGERRRGRALDPDRRRARRDPVRSPASPA